MFLLVFISVKYPFPPNLGSFNLSNLSKPCPQKLPSEMSHDVSEKILVFKACMSLGNTGEEAKSHQEENNRCKNRKVSNIYTLEYYKLIIIINYYILLLLLL